MVTRGPLGSDEPDPVTRLDPFDEAPPADAVVTAEEIVRRIVEPDSGGMLRWRRGSATNPPVLSFSDSYVVGRLDLRAVDFPYLLRFQRCRFEEPPDLRQAKFGGCQFRHCALPGILARNLRSDSDLVVAESRVEGKFDLADANISGSLDLDDTTLHNPGDRALQADRLVLAGALLGVNLTVRGVLRLAGARTGGNISFLGAELHNDTGLAFNGNGLYVGGSLIWGAREKSRGSSELPTREYGQDIGTVPTIRQDREPFRSTGLIFLPNAHIESDIYLRGARLRPSAYRSPFNPNEDPQHDPLAVLVADRLTVEGNVTMDNRHEDGAASERPPNSTGTVRMINARIGGSLRLTGTRIDVSGHTRVQHTPHEHRALHLDGTAIHGDFDLQRSVIIGENRMTNLWVRGGVFASGAHFDNPDGDAWEARGLTVRGAVEFRNVSVRGSLLMQGATIDANADFRAVEMLSPGIRRQPRSARRWSETAYKPSLDVRAVTIGQDLICAAGDENAFVARGGVRMHGAKVGRETTFDGAELWAPERGTALNAFGMTTQELVLTVGKRPAGPVVLRHAHCNVLDDNETFWKATTQIDLEGFRYDAFADPVALKDDARVAQRMRWMHRTMRDSYRPGPYDQLAAMLRASGNEEHASTVQMGKQRMRYRALADGYTIAGPAIRVWSALQRSMVGYGYRPMRALAWLIVLLGLGTLWFGIHPEICDFDPIGTLTEQHCSISSDDSGLVWNPFLYTLDLLIPIVDFGNKGRWHMSGIDLWMSSAFIAAGWILATNVAAGATNVIRRQ